MTKIQEKTDAHNNFSRLEKELELITRQTDKLLQEKENLHNQKIRLEQSLREAESQLAERLNGQEVSKQRLKAAEDKLKTNQSELASLEEKLAGLRQAAAELTYELQALGKITEAEREIRARGLPGALGWFSELIEVPEGEAPLFDLFWKEEARAQACLVDDFKKMLPAEIKTNILLLAEKPPKDWPAGILEEAGVLGKLTGRLKTRDQLAGHLGRLKEALIVSDLETAIGLWEKYPELNYISQAGDVLESSGLLRPAEKREGLFTLEQEKRKLQKEIDRLEAEQLPLLSSLSSQKEAYRRRKPKLTG
jgi:chromosome segregation ATPase